MSDVNVLAALAQKKNNGTSRVRPQVVVNGTGDEVTVALVFSLSDIQKSASGEGGRSIIFALIPVEFILPDGTVFQFSSPRLSISAR